LVEHEAATTTILPDVDKLMQLSSDNPVQDENVKPLRPPVEARLAEFAKAVDFVKRNDTAGGIAMRPEVGASETVRKIAEISGAMRAEEDRLFRLRTDTADRAQQLASIVR
jgi:CHASE3 domain sensor protein